MTVHTADNNICFYADVNLTYAGIQPYLSY
jgi:hypothetical protein